LQYVYLVKTILKTGGLNHSRRQASINKRI
jgi:hypothetical protein